MATFSQKCARACKAEYNINYMPALETVQTLLADADFRLKVHKLVDEEPGLSRVDAVVRLAKPTIDKEFT